MTITSRAFAALYDSLAAREDARGGAALRELLVADAGGEVLELGAGTGRCLPHYRCARRVVALEPDDAMRRYAARRAAAATAPVEVVPGDARALPFNDETFDTVVAAWVLCTIPEPTRALAEVARVLRPDGTLRFLEHVRATDQPLVRWQDRLELPWRLVARGCRCNQDTVGLIWQAALPSKTSTRGISRQRRRRLSDPPSWALPRWTSDKSARSCC